MKTYGKQWFLTALLVAGGAGWIMRGRALARRTVFAPPAAREADRTETEFLALVLPRITRRGSRFTYSGRELSARLKALKKEGYVSVGLKDVDDLYRKGRGLPPKAVLLAFGQDDAQGIEIADRVLKRLRLRGTAFISRAAQSAEIDERRYLTRHALDQMRRGGAWEFGWIAQSTPPAVAEMSGAFALFDPDGSAPKPKDAQRYRLRFAGSEMGHNTAADKPGELRALVLRAGRPVEEDLRIVRNSWPRQGRFEDRFDGPSLEGDWITGWGVVRSGGKRLALLPAPRQTGAGVFLRGTEKWRDIVVEFELKKHQKEFWVYARYKDDGSFVRAGARDGFWYVEQKVGSRGLPTMLGKSPLIDTGAPQRARFVLKGATALLHVGGRMMFGRSLRINPAVDQGRVLLGVYDSKLKTSLAVLTYVRAEPVAERWIALKNMSALDDSRLESLREGIIHARAVTPRWLSVTRDGAVIVNSEQQTLIRSLAGFYACRLIPMAELPPLAGLALDGPAAERLSANLASAAKELDAAGLNLRVRGEDLERPEAVRFLARMRKGFAARKRELWITVDGRTPSDPAVRRSVDGMLSPVPAGKEQFEILEAAPAGPATLTTETASN